MRTAFILLLATALVGGCASTPRVSTSEDTAEVRKTVKGAKGQEAFDLGYVRGQADQTKRHYWMLQDLHASGEEDSGTLRYYTMPGRSTTEDGQRLVDHEVTIPIVE
jgi:hypothetical protein